MQSSKAPVLKHSTKALIARQHGPQALQTLQPQPIAAAAVLPPELWAQVWSGLDKAFFPAGGHPELHMEGSCKCGKLKYRVDGTLAAAFHCHCHMCRKHWSQGTPQHIAWIQPESAITFTEGREHLGLYVVEKLTHNLRGQATVNFCRNCGTKINVEFSDPNAKFTLAWPFDFKYAEWGDTSGKGDKARHGYSEVMQPRFHAHYENRTFDVEDGLPKLADIWLEGMPLMNNKGESIGKVSYPMPGFEKGWMSSPTHGAQHASSASSASATGDPDTRKKALQALASAIDAISKL